MFLPHKQKTHDNERLTPPVWPWKNPQREEAVRSEIKTARFAELSGLSAKIIELSLQEAQPDPTLLNAVPNTMAPVTWPFLGTSADALRHAEQPVDDVGRPGTVAQNENLSGTPHQTPQTAQGISHTSRSYNFAA